MGAESGTDDGLVEERDEKSGGEAGEDKDDLLLGGSWSDPEASRFDFVLGGTLGGGCCGGTIVVIVVIESGYRRGGAM